MIEKGFDFLGYHFSHKPLQLANQTVRRHVEHINRLYEQQTTKKATSKKMALVLGLYAKRQLGWRLTRLRSDAFCFWIFGLLAITMHYWLCVIMIDVSLLTRLIDFR